MSWLPIRSRLGNALLLALGVVFAAASLTLLGYYMIDTWGYASKIDRALQMMLAGVAVYGLFLVREARQNLKHRTT